MELAGAIPTMIESIFVSQLKTLPVRLVARRADRGAVRIMPAR